MGRRAGGGGPLDEGRSTLSTIGHERRALDALVAGRTVLDGLLDAADAAPDDDAIRWWAGDRRMAVTWGHYAEATAAVAAGLAGLGVSAGDRVLLMMRNRPEFGVLDLACVALGAVPVSLHTNASLGQLLACARDAGATVAVAEPASLERLRDAGFEVGQPVVIDEPVPDGPALDFGGLAGPSAIDLAAAARSLDPGSPATLLYTSGATGVPKAVPVEHTTICWTVASLLRRFGEPLVGWEVISYLPMAHIAERMATHYLHLAQRMIVTTCPTPLALPGLLGAVRPHLFVGVPRVWSTARKLIEAGVDRGPGGRRQFDAALETGRRLVRARAAGAGAEGRLATEWQEADRAVLAGVRALLGLDRCRVAISASAPLGAELAEFFLAMGVPLSEMYGLSETCGPVAWRPDDIHPGTCGPPIPGCEVRLAANGEILVRGGNVFSGYGGSVQTPIDDDGFFHTGDVGAFDADGCLAVTGREKDMIVTAGGTNVAPAGLEALLRDAALVEDACVFGEGRPFLAALLTVDLSAARTLVGPSAAELSDDALAEHPSVRRAIEGDVAALNATLSAEERVHRVAILPDHWSPGSAELTPTDKLRRAAIAARYSDRIEQLYRTRS